MPALGGHPAANMRATCSDGIALEIAASGNQDGAEGRPADSVAMGSRAILQMGLLDGLQVSIFP